MAQNAQFYTFRVQCPLADAPGSDENEKYLNSFLQIIETDNKTELLEVYLRTNLACSSVEGFSLGVDGVKPLVEEPEMRLGVRLRLLVSDASPFYAFDYFLREMLDGELAIPGVKCLETKLKGLKQFMYIWVTAEAEAGVHAWIKRQFPGTYVTVQPNTTG